MDQRDPSRCQRLSSPLPPCVHLCLCAPSPSMCLCLCLPLCVCLSVSLSLSVFLSGSVSAPPRQSRSDYMASLLGAGHPGDTHGSPSSAHHPS